MHANPPVDVRPHEPSPKTQCCFEWELLAQPLCRRGMVHPQSVHLAGLMCNYEVMFLSK